MPSDTPVTPPAQRSEAKLRSLVVALLLFAATVGFISSCGSDDLIFPGMLAATRTAEFTVTPTPTDG